MIPLLVSSSALFVYAGSSGGKSQFLFTTLLDDLYLAWDTYV
jgi:hypothetical protein